MATPSPSPSVGPNRLHQASGRLMHMTRQRRIGTGVATLALAAGLLPMAARAGGPGQFVTPDGKPYKRDNSQSLTYNLDLGKLGALSTTKAAILVETAVGALQ